jgi:hypothetical protein
MKNTQTEVVTTLNGFRLAISVDGTLTGRGGDIIIIDDPIAALAAMSQKSREHVRDWYFNTLLSRLDDKQNGAIVLVMQRLHEDDLAGVLLRGSDEWTVLNLPAIAQQDEKIPIGNGQVRVRRAPLKSAAIPLGTIMVLSSGAALAQDQLTKAGLVQLVVTLGVYDNRKRKARSQAAGRLTAHGPDAWRHQRTREGGQSGRGEVV